jgi:hypothetical protein
MIPVVNVLDPRHSALLMMRCIRKSRMKLARPMKYTAGRIAMGSELDRTSFDEFQESPRTLGSVESPFIVQFPLKHVIGTSDDSVPQNLWIR